jgi:hypothetical protein
MDPWWNPAVEDQAADRAHRIGQDRPVMVYRLVAEEPSKSASLLLQEAKRGIADAALGEAARAASLTRCRPPRVTHVTNEGTLPFLLHFFRLRRNVRERGVSPELAALAVRVGGEAGVGEAAGALAASEGGLDGGG